MGVQRLQTYIHQHKLGRNIDLFKSDIKKVIIDGDSVSFFLYESSKLSRIYGGEYYDLYKYIFTFFQALLNIGLELLVVFDGIPPAEKRNTIQERRKMKCSNGVNLWKSIDSNLTNQNVHVPITRPGFIRNVMKQVLKHFNVPMCHSLAENDDYIVQLIKEQGYHAVLAKDTDFLIYDVKNYLPVNYLVMKRNAVYAKVVSKNDLCRHFRLQEKYLPLFAFVAGNDITHGSKVISDVLYKIHQQAKPNILRNLANMIIYHMDQIMQMITDDIVLMEGMLLCYKKYNATPCLSSTIFNLPEAYDRHFMDPLEDGLSQLF